MDTMRTDTILMEILRERKTITGFLDSIFGFLRRNTDFYHVKKSECEKIGFAKGIREKILFSAMQSYDPEFKINKLVSEDGDDVPPAVEEVEVSTADMDLDEDNVNNKEKHFVPNIKTKEQTFSPSDYKNGSMFENYCWSQTLKDIELHVNLPVELRSAKQLIIDIKADNITVRSRHEPSILIISGKLSNKIKHNDAVWTIAENNLLISFDKTKEIWWEKFFTYEDCVDIKKLDCERYIDELPEESQAAIHKLRVQQMEQDSKNQPIMSPDETEVMKRLKMAWDNDGSPFKGQPFDPSVVKFS